MKLNVKRTILVGFAYLAINSFWQMHGNLIPKILTETFRIGESLSGVLMALDNVLALFLLPLFGGLSDKCTSRLGRRRPFILYGTLSAVVFMLLLPVLADSYHADPQQWKVVAFILALGALLVAMGTYRSPAVALMPDVTPKPLRSKANAIIKLMGAFGGIVYLVITTFLYRSSADVYVSYMPMFLIVGGIMLSALVVVMLFVDEPKLVAQQRAYELAHPEQAPEVSPSGTLPAEVKRSLAFLLVSVVLWWIGYNGVITWFSVYAGPCWSMTLGQANTCMAVATATAIASYIPVGNYASRTGRKRTIRIGILMLAAAFFGGFVYSMLTSDSSPVLYLLFAVAGTAWAFIDVNALPMVVEMCKGSEAGKYTGVYYTFSTTAQILTPVMAGWLMEHVGYRTLFPYAALFVAASFFTMGFVRHGDNKLDTAKHSKSAESV